MCCFWFDGISIYIVKEKTTCAALNVFNKNAPVKVEGNLMFSQRDNPYCDLLQGKCNS